MKNINTVTGLGFPVFSAVYFFYLIPTQIHDALDGKGKAMIAMREGERVNIMTEVARCTGPAADTRDGDYALAPCIQMGSFNAMEGLHEYELSAWYAKWRLPRLSKLDGTLAVRKLVSVAGWAKHAILYEFISTDARNQKFVDHESADPEMEQWTDDVVRLLDHAPGSPNLAKRIWPPLS